MFKFRVVMALTVAAWLLVPAAVGAVAVGTFGLAAAAPRAAGAPPPDPTCAPRVSDGATICVESLREPPAPTGPEAGITAATPKMITSWVEPAPGANPIAAPVPCVGTGTDGKRLVAVYATSAGYVDRYQTVAPKIRQWAGQASQEVWFASAGQTYGQKLRWATTAPQHGLCAPTVTKVVVPAENFETATAAWDYLAGHGYNDVNAHYIIWTEAPMVELACGLGQTTRDDRRDPAVNDANSGTMFAWLTPVCWENGVLHEVLHTLGATNPVAPHATKGGHCTDGADLMCYSDGLNVKVTARCPVPSYVRQPLWGGLDCGRDTYYNLAPAAGTYLADHWNVASSPFLHRTGPAPANPAVVSASGPKTATPGTTFTLSSGARTAPAGRRPGSPSWVAPTGCKVTHPTARTTTATCNWLTSGTKAFRAISTDKHGRLAARTVKVSVPAPANRALTGTITPATRTAKAGTPVRVTLTVKDKLTGRPVAGVPVRLWGHRTSSSAVTLWAKGVTNASGQAKVSYRQPSTPVAVSASSAYSLKRWTPWVSRWVTIKAR